MRKPSSGWGRRRAAILVTVVVGAAGCATPEYAVRSTPVPVETAEALQIERTLSQLQARTFDAQGARQLLAGERLRGLDVPGVIERLRVVTERPALPYRAWLYADDDPNAAALADGRIYLSTGMVAYLASRGSRSDELAFILAHELAHTVAQHLVKRYHVTRQQQALLGLVAAGASLVARGGGAGTQQVGQLAMDAASLLANVAASGYGQADELEADQLGIRYVMRAGFAPAAALAVLEDFQRFESPGPFLRTHPYVRERLVQLRRYLTESTSAPGRSTGAPSSRPVMERLQRLRQAQPLYPVGSISWRNLQQQIQALERSLAGP